MTVDDLSVGQIVESVRGRAFRVEYVNRRDRVVGLRPLFRLEWSDEVWTYLFGSFEPHFRPYSTQSISNAGATDDG